jgi:hypothetical protein
MGISDRILTIGSCFADIMGSRLRSAKVTTLANPFGNLYNPYSIFKAIQYAIANELPTANTFLQHQDVFLNYDFHSELSSLRQDKLLSQLTEIIGTSHNFIKNAQWLILTFGTAWVYTQKDTGEVVANCHKQPKALFTKSLMTQKQIMSSFDSFYHDLRQLNPAIKIILTVSPVRHLNDTLELNSVSKSVLRTSCYTIVQENPEITYFPAYEILLDDLRDYRFYKPDMIHPNIVAEDYIWSSFTTSYFDPSLLDFLHTWRNIQNALAHKPFHPTSIAHQAFLKELLATLEGFRGMVNVEEEITQIKAQLL